MSESVLASEIRVGDRLFRQSEIFADVVEVVPHETYIAITVRQELRYRPGQRVVVYRTEQKESTL